VRPPGQLPVRTGACPARGVASIRDDAGGDERGLDLTAADDEIYAFCRAHSWRVWVKGPYHDAIAVASWPELERARAWCQVVVAGALRLAAALGLQALSASYLWFVWVFARLRPVRDAAADRRGWSSMAPSCSRRFATADPWAS
jgi:hypothetical protein